MLRRLYDWTLSLAARKSAEWWLAIIAFVESSVFLVPADVLFLPMALARPDRAYRYAGIATTASVLGGVAGWMLGYFAYETIAKPILEFYGKLEGFEAADESSDDPVRRHACEFVVVRPIGDPGAWRAFLFPGVAFEEIWRTDPSFHRKAPRADRGGRRGCPDFALHHRQIPVLTRWLKY